MKINLKRHLLGLSLLLLFLPAAIFAQEKSEEILFVGNSFTYFYNMPQMLEAMAKDQGVDLRTSQSTVGGSNLAQHWSKEKGTETRSILENEKFDYVVLQDHSMSTIDAPERFTTYASKLINLVKEKGAEPLLSMTWAYDSNPLMQETISTSYIQLGKETKVKVVPVGSIFMQAQKVRPDLKMYFDDKHPSSDGSYLIALIYYKYFTGKSVLDIPNRLITKDSEGDKLYLCFVLPETGAFLRQLVEDFDMGSFKSAH
ncbi:DUF4886 domain-containing protein [Christiangramia sp. SM2212]|uniref:SGNH/GDSL hydrolase family protein n=1 Tax=Christiangramia sediminicola TaxID=3073267 RepID=A0ABU1EUQ0_9FLAO|nr:DUF4886 domain-containing protein [Christiangramia sp. SM2212]MDR5591908.1 hypothetical protein [Christiangramia sp. SM2212]